MKRLCIRSAGIATYDTADECREKKIHANLLFPPPADQFSFE